MLIKKHSFFILLFFNVVSVFSQDSIFFKNKTIIVAKISEINVSDIKYRRFDNMDGTQFVITKSEIQSIKYANGNIEDFSTTIQNPTSTSTTDDFRPYNGKPNAINQTPQSNTNFSDAKIDIKYNNRLVYNNHVLSEGKFWTLIDNFPNKEGKIKLQDEWKSLKKYKAGQMISGFTGLGLGIGAPIFGIAYASNNSYYSTTQETLQTIGASIGSGVILGITGAIISAVFKAKRNSKKAEIARMYNELR